MVENRKIERKEVIDNYRVQKKFEELMDVYAHSNHRHKTDRITKAYNLASQAHNGVKRQDGDPYIMHPVEVALIICKELGLGSTSICAALLHDVVEDTSFEVEDIANMFDHKIAQLVEGLTKIPKDQFINPDMMQAENFRKLLLTLADDIRVVIVKLADRLHNMRTLGAKRSDKIAKIAAETMIVYAPLAHRLGLFSIKTELEDLCFKYEHPEDYQIIRQKIESTEMMRQQFFNDFAKPIRERLDAMTTMTYKIKARVKGVYSIWNKMVSQNIAFEDIYDVFAVRIIFDPIEEVNENMLCWDIYGVITETYRSNNDRLRDWVSRPKVNGYKSLHLTVMGLKGQWVEVQIRSKKMDEIDERGFAAHWQYKEHIEEDNELSHWLDTFVEILDDPNPDALDFLDKIKMSLCLPEIYVFTPKGDTKTLPKDATALDFAYFLHSDIGNSCIGAKVNHRLVPLSHRLKTGDQVEILTSKSQTPKNEWLTFANTTNARTKITAELRRIRKEMVQTGHEQILTYFRLAGIEPSQSFLDRLMAHFEYNKREDLYYAVACGEIQMPENLRKELREKKDGNPILRMFGMGKKKSAVAASSEEAQETDTDAAMLAAAANAAAASKKYDKSTPYDLTEDVVGHRNYEVADCCKPIPGDDAFGFINNDDKIIVHKQSCPIGMNLKSAFGNRILAIRWSNHVNRSFEAKLKIRGIDKIGMLTSIARTISEYNVNIIRLLVEVKDNVFECTLNMLVHDVGDIRKMSDAIKKLENIVSVARIGE